MKTERMIMSDRLMSIVQSSGQRGGRDRGVFFMFCVIFNTLFFLCVGVAAHAEVVSTFGDSITEGYGQTPYSAFLQGMINQNHPNVRVANFGKRGERTDHGVSRIGGVLAQSHPRFILIMEGANDVNAGISASTVKFNLGVMVDKSRQAGATPVLGNITPNTLFPGHDYNSLISSSYNPAIAGIAAAKGVRLVDGYHALIGNWSNLNVDGLHPTSAGQKILAQLFYGVLPYMNSTDTGGGTDSKGKAKVTTTSGGGGGGCFIATAAFGSLQEPHVVLLRQFRDRCLLTNTVGTLFVRTYYKLSPPLADFIAQHEGLRAAVRVCLYPLIGLSWLSLNHSWVIVAALVFLGILMFTIRIVVSRYLCRHPYL